MWDGLRTSGICHPLCWQMFIQLYCAPGGTIFGLNSPWAWTPYMSKPPWNGQTLRKHLSSDFPVVIFARSFELCSSEFSVSPKTTKGMQNSCDLWHVTDLDPNVQCSVLSTLTRYLIVQHTVYLWRYLLYPCKISSQCMHYSQQIYYGIYAQLIQWVTAGDVFRNLNLIPTRKGGMFRCIMGSIVDWNWWWALCGWFHCSLNRIRSSHVWLPKEWFWLWRNWHR